MDSPGLKYLFNRLPFILAPVAVICAFDKIALVSYGLDLPKSLLILMSIVAIPTMIILKSKIRDFIAARTAAANGAILPPSVYDPYPGGIGLLLELLGITKEERPGDLFNDRAQKYGMTWNFKILWEDRYFTTEPEYIKAILATQFDAFEKGPVFRSQVHSLLGSGVFNSDGDLWKFHRAMTRPFFSRDRITHFEIFERHARDAISQMKARLKEGYPIDIQDVASRFTMDSATEFLFAEDVQSLSAGLPYPHYASHLNTAGFHNHPANTFARALDEAQVLTDRRGPYGSAWALAEFWTDKVKDKMTPVYEFLDPILDSAVQKKRGSGKEDGFEKSGTPPQDREIKDDESLLDHLVNYTADKTLLRDETLNILIAGRDTTSSSITFSTYMLAKHPKVFRKLRAEVLEKLGTDRAPTYEDMKDMKYLRAVVNETLRLYPAVPFNVRRSTKELILPGKNGGPNLYIPGGSKFTFSIFMMHRRTDLWGPDALVYDPDRFIDERLHQYLVSNPFIFLPFSAGPRICLGQQFAYHETSYFLICLLQTFSDIELALDAQPPESLPPPKWKDAVGGESDELRLKTHLTMSILGGCWVKLTDAEINP